MAVISKPSWTIIEVQTHIGKDGRWYEMGCACCGGLMVLEEFEDFVLESSGDEFFGRRCVNCGEIVDPLIAAHRRLTSQPATTHSALTIV